MAIGFAAGALIVSVLLGKSGLRTRTKDSAYECGMVPQGEAQPRFSVKFYLVAMLFILFDLEIVFMYPWAVVYREADRAQPRHSLEHAKLCFDSDGRLRLRAEKRRARLEKIATPGRFRVIQEDTWTDGTASPILACVTIEQRLIAILSWFITSDSTN